VPSFRINVTLFLVVMLKFRDNIISFPTFRAGVSVEIHGLTLNLSQSLHLLLQNIIVITVAKICF